MSDTVDPQWVERALVEYECRLLRYAQRFVGRDRAADVVQETFLKLCRETAPAVNGSLAPWLYTVCRNVALDLLRKESRMTATLEIQVSQPARESPDSTAEVRDGAGRILQELATLSPNQQECVRLKFQDGMSYAEIASITGLSVSNVGFQLHAALKALRERLGKESF